MKKPWYIWFSVFALLILLGDTRRKASVRHISELNNSEKLNRNLSANGQALISALYVMLPMIPFAVLSAYFDAKSPNITMYIVIIQLIVLYFCGVYATYKHYLWREKNLPKDSM